MSMIRMIVRPIAARLRRSLLNWLCAPAMGLLMLGCVSTQPRPLESFRDEGEITGVSENYFVELEVEHGVLQDLEIRQRVPGEFGATFVLDEQNFLFIVPLNIDEDRTSVELFFVVHEDRGETTIPVMERMVVGDTRGIRVAHPLGEMMVTLIDIEDLDQPIRGYRPRECVQTFLANLTRPGSGSCCMAAPGNRYPMVCATGVFIGDALSCDVATTVDGESLNYPW